MTTFGGSPRASKTLGPPMSRMHQFSGLKLFKEFSNCLVWYALRSLKERARWARVNYGYNIFQSLHGDKNKFTYDETRLINQVCLKFGQKSLEM